MMHIVHCYFTIRIGLQWNVRRGSFIVAMVCVSTVTHCVMGLITVKTLGTRLRHVVRIAFINNFQFADAYPYFWLQAQAVLLSRHSPDAFIWQSSDFIIAIGIAWKKCRCHVYRHLSLKRGWYSNDYFTIILHVFDDNYDDAVYELYLDIYLSDHSCKRSAMGEYYKGTLSVSLTGKQCLSWVSFPSDYDWMMKFPDSVHSQLSNFCRNPDRKPLGPWCYVDLNGQWEYCAIALCSGENGYVITRLID